VRWVASHSVGGKKQRGSRKSRRVRGISPNRDIPEAEEEQEDTVGTAPDEVNQD